MLPIRAEFGDLLDRKLRGSDPKVRREYVHLLVDQVEVGAREVRITGSNAMLERAVVACPKLNGNGAPTMMKMRTGRSSCSESGGRRRQLCAP